MTEIRRHFRADVTAALPPGGRDSDVSRDRRSEPTGCPRRDVTPGRRPGRKETSGAIEAVLSVLAVLASAAEPFTQQAAEQGLARPVGNLPSRPLATHLPEPAHSTHTGPSQAGAAGREIQ